jgi:hypothetical protein
VHCTALQRHYHHCVEGRALSAQQVVSKALRRRLCLSSTSEATACRAPCSKAAGNSSWWSHAARAEGRGRHLPQAHAMARRVTRQNIMSGLGPQPSHNQAPVLPLQTLLSLPSSSSEAPPSSAPSAHLYQARKAAISPFLPPRPPIAMGEPACAHDGDHEAAAEGAGLADRAATHSHFAGSGTSRQATVTHVSPAEHGTHGQPLGEAEVRVLRDIITLRRGPPKPPCACWADCKPRGGRRPSEQAAAWSPRHGEARASPALQS